MVEFRPRASATKEASSDTLSCCWLPTTMWSCCFNSPAAKDKGKTTSVKLADEFSKGMLIPLYSENEMERATNNFHISNRIGGGGFGVVYKGVLKDDMKVAIKKLATESKQGDHEFLTEIHAITNTRHPNLVRLVGCCVQGSCRMLVYEYVENNSLAHALLGPKHKKLALDWSRRAAICLGMARGLAYLHEEVEPYIVHRDIKSSNILLDKDFLPKIGDFGLAKLFPDNVSHISTRVAGTIGYLAPEYALLGQLTRKADVYSFGVVLLEIISGRSVSSGSEETSLLETTWGFKKQGKLLEIVDEDMVEYPEEEVLRVIRVALFCTQATASYRPTMTQVVSMLSEKVDLNDDSLTEPNMLRDHNRLPRGGLTASSLRRGAFKGKQFMGLSTTSIAISGASVTEVYPR